MYRRLLRFARPYAGRLLVAAGLLLHRGLYQRLYERTFEHRETVAAS